MCVGRQGHSSLRRTNYPVAGRMYCVERISIEEFTSGRFLALWLLDGPKNLGDDKVWPALRFVKVTPPEANEFDREVIDLLIGEPVA